MSETLLTLLWWLWPPLAALFAIWSGVFCYRSHQYLRRVQAEDRRREAELRERANISERIQSIGFDPSPSDLAKLSPAIRSQRSARDASPSDGGHA